MTTILSVATLLVLATLSGAHKLAFNQCLSLTGMDNFDKTQMYGRWYINQIVSSINTCMTLDFSEKPGNSDAIKISQGRQISALDAVDFKHTTTYAGSASVTGNKPSEMTINWPVSGMLGSMSYVILDTDYTTYALTYECMGVLWVGSYYSYSILSRDPVLDDATLEKVRETAAAAGLKISKLKVVSQANCIKPGEGVNIDTDPDSYNVLGLISDEKLETIKTEEDLIVELGLDKHGTR